MGRISQIKPPGFASEDKVPGKIGSVIQDIYVSFGNYGWVSFRSEFRILIPVM